MRTDNDDVASLLCHDADAGFLSRILPVQSKGMFWETPKGFCCDCAIATVVPVLDGS